MSSDINNAQADIDKLLIAIKTEHPAGIKVGRVMDTFYTLKPCGNVYRMNGSLKANKNHALIFNLIHLDHFEFSALGKQTLPWVKKILTDDSNLMSTF